ncbi:MAG TPA: NAD(P)-binding domain-containing protein [Propionicimonas sp.]|nr:NAD(P)-binding domain-containing protein [Propionicimonas sp.]
MAAYFCHDALARASSYAAAVEDSGGIPDVEVVVIGAGQAGLAVSHELSDAGVEHVVLERDRVASSWRRRWDSFTLVTPNWMIRLPGGAYHGDDPDGFLDRGQVVDHLADYAAHARAPILEGVAVTGLEPAPGSRLRLTTSLGAVTVGSVVVCTGSFARAVRPLAEALPASIQQLDAVDYRNPDDVAPGTVVVVGSGQTGCQLAEELQLAGRDVVLACGRAPWIPRRLAGRDTLSWLADVGFLDAPLASLPTPAARLVSNPQATGRGGGHDLHYRTLQAMGVRLAGRLATVDETRLGFADDLAASVAFGDARWADLCALMKAKLPERGLHVPDLPVPPAFHASPLEPVPVREVSAVLFTSGYRPGYVDWVRAPVFDDLGFPVTTDAATAVPGLYFCGAHFQRTRGSGILYGVGQDATGIAEAVALGRLR